MATTRHRPRLQLEVLERRETPSSFAGAQFHTLAARPAAIVQRFSGRGSAVPTGQPNTGSITGTTKLPGQPLQLFNGTMTINIAPNQRFVSGVATMIVGDSSANSINGNFRGPIRLRGSTLNGNGLSFTISPANSDPSNQFAKVRGGGRLNLTGNISNQTLNFTFNGNSSIRPS